MTAERVYLDYNATAPLRDESRDAVCAALELHGNPSSVHKEGRQVRALVECAREQVAALVGAEPRNVIFTSGGTESNVTALAPENADRAEAKQVACLVSAIEHPSVMAGGRFTADAIQLIPVTGEGVVDLAALESLLADQPAETDGAGLLVSVMTANNETGAVQPVAEVAALVRAHGGVLHVDAVQSAGKIPFDLGQSGAHMISLAAHKIGGPKGVGALVLASGYTLKAPLITGGGQELGYRAGTENVSGIGGFGAAAELVHEDLEKFQALATLRDRLEQEVKGLAPEAVFIAGGVQRLANTSCFAVPGLKSESLVIALDLAGIAISAGSACSSGKVRHSHVLEAMGVAPEVATGAVRASLGWATGDADVDKFLSAFGGIYRQFRQEQAAA